MLLMDVVRSTVISSFQEIVFLKSDSGRGGGGPMFLDLLGEWGVGNISLMEEHRGGLGGEGRCWCCCFQALTFEDSEASCE